MSVETEEKASPVSRWDWRELKLDASHAALFGVLAIGWLLLFHFLGNSTFGYIRSPSLFGWMGNVYDNNEDDWHGFLIPFVVLGVLWWKRSELAALPKRHWWPAMIIVASGLLIHVFGFLVQQVRFSIVGCFFGLWGLVGVVWGPAVLRSTFFPFLLFIFCVPISSVAETITFPLRQLATWLTAVICNSALGIDVKQVGTKLLDPSGNYSYEVAAACSGIRSLTAIFAMTAVYAFVFFDKTWKRAAIITAALPLAVISNVLRLLMIILASEAFSAKAGHTVHESTWLSLLPYIISFVGVLSLGRWLKEDRDVDVRALVVPVALGGGAFVILHWLFKQAQERGLLLGSGPVVFIVIAAAVIALACFRLATWRAGLTRAALVVGLAVLASVGATAGFLIEQRTSQRLSEPGVKVVNEPIYAVDDHGSNRVLVAEQSVFLPEEVLHYRSSAYPVSAVELQFLPKDTVYGQRRYVAPDDFTWAPFSSRTGIRMPFIIQNMVRLMGNDRTSIHQPQMCLRGQGFEIVSEEEDTIRLHQPVPYDLPVMKLKVRGRMVDQSGAQHDIGGVYVYWFVSDKEVSARLGDRLWQTSLNLVRTGVLTRWAYVICMAFSPVGQEEVAYERVEEFIRASLPEYQSTAGKPLTEMTSSTGASERTLP